MTETYTVELTDDDLTQLQHALLMARVRLQESADLWSDKGYGDLATQQRSKERSMHEIGDRLGLLRNGSPLPATEHGTRQRNTCDHTYAVAIVTDDGALHATIVTASHVSAAIFTAMKILPEGAKAEKWTVVPTTEGAVSTTAPNGPGRKRPEDWRYETGRSDARYVRDHGRLPSVAWTRVRAEIRREAGYENLAAYWDGYADEIEWFG
jgi:hypothetical protein